ncbi:MAG: protein kinase [Acidobacteriota bacterium]
MGFWAHRSLESSIREDLGQELQTLLDADVTALRLWADRQRLAVAAQANLPEVRDLAAELLRQRARWTGPGAFPEFPAAAALRRRLDPVVADLGHPGWGVIAPDLTLIATGRPELLGTSLRARGTSLERALAGSTVLTAPLPAGSLVPGGEAFTGKEVTMFAAAPIRSGDDVIAVLGFRVSPREFTRILTVARMGESGEAYAFDADGVLLSVSRFEEQLRAIGLLPADPAVSSVLNVEIRNPGGNMLRGFRPPDPVRARPLTRMAAEAIAGGSGVDVSGYPDYRGVPVVGAWTWLPDLEMGVALEVDVAQGYAMLFRLRRGLWGLVGLLAVGCLGILIYALLVGRLSKRVEEVARLGQYRLIRKIGEGGMGQVYLAEHAMLRRPTAVKMIRGDGADERQMKRFEREVQFTSQLSHPNTIRVFDFGRTPKGVFYYAMEYLEGITLRKAVEVGGPFPEERAIFILEQICGALAEAHGAGLIHRDIKPANIILCERGGLHDFVKVLDFGLVRRVDQSETAALTQTQMITGTPLYLAPEGITAPDTVDGRSDLYSLGGVGYYLLTGQPVFEGDAFEVCGQHVHARPQPPSARLGRTVSPDLEAILMACLEKEPGRRPAGAREMREALLACKSAGGWTEGRARRWWEETLDWSAVKGDLRAAPATPRTADRTALSVDLGSRLSRRP